MRVKAQPYAARRRMSSNQDIPVFSCADVKMRPMSGRDPQRIERVLAVLRDVWLIVPNWRLGQIIVNASESPDNQPCSHIFFLDDAEMEKLLIHMRDELRRIEQNSN